MTNIYKAKFNKAKLCSLTVLRQMAEVKNQCGFGIVLASFLEDEEESN